MTVYENEKYLSFLRVFDSNFIANKTTDHPEKLLSSWHSVTYNYLSGLQRFSDRYRSVHTDENSPNLRRKCVQRYALRRYRTKSFF